MEKIEVIEKIKKLLTLSNDPSASKGEVEAAALLAQKLLLKNELSIDELYESVQDGEKVEEAEAKGKYLVMWYYVSLANTVAENFRCAVFYRVNQYRGTRKVVFVGKKVDVEIAKNAYDLLRKRLDKDIDIFEKELKASKNYVNNMAVYRNDYTKGWLKGLETKFENQVAQYALVPVKPPEVSDYMNNLHASDMRQTSRWHANDASTIDRGRKDGFRAGSTFDKKELS
jgi:hypothetical protein